MLQSGFGLGQLLSQQKEGSSGKPEYLTSKAAKEIVTIKISSGKITKTFFISPPVKKFLTYYNRINFDIPQIFAIIILIMKKILLSVFVISILYISCSNNKCNFGFKSKSPSQSSLTVSTGTKVEFSAEPELCGEERAVQFSWRLNGNEVSTTNQYILFACASVVGENKVELTISDSEGNSASSSWNIKVNPADPPAKPQCVIDAIKRIQEGGRFGDYGPYFNSQETAQNVSDFTSARDCIDSYLNEYACDVHANYADAIAKITLELNSIDSMIVNRAQRFSRAEIIDLLDNRIRSIEENLLLVMQEGAYVDFSRTGFLIPKILEIGVFEGEPETLEDDIAINLSGRHDLGEVSLFLTGIKNLKGALEVLLSYNSMIEFGGTVPDDFSFEDVVGMLIDRMEADPEFLMLAGPGGTEGKRRLLNARLFFADGLRSIMKTMDMVMAEKGDQTNSVLRYWDCGRDAVCPGDPEERSDPSKPCSETGYQDKNFNGECNRAHCSTPGANPADCEAPDEGEANGQFDSGEPIGTQMVAYYDIGSFTYRRVTFPASALVRNAIELIAKNIEGPDALNFNDLLGLPSGTAEAFLNGFGIPVPEIRLSEFFVTPSNLRDLFPLYSRAERFLIYHTELEDFYDVGYDGCSDSMEDGAGGCSGNPGGSPDPNHDNLNILTDCEDGFDNDSDGSVDEHNSSGVCADLGPENDLQFSFIDANGNGRFDPGEVSEPFDDTGVYNGRDTTGAGNGNLDRIDVDHYWPQGGDVGGAHPGIEKDPRNTVAQDQQDGDGRDFCIDPYYFFLPDPTISGVVTFPQQIINIDGEELNNNAKLHRFVSKSLETLEEFGVIE